MTRFQKVSFTHPAEVLPLDDAQIITIIGAGGKTTLLYALAGYYGSFGNTLLTTTTHIGKPDPADLKYFERIEAEDFSAVTTALSSGANAALGIPVQKNGMEKWSSPSLAFLEKCTPFCSHIICEGDGARRLPVKVPKSHEPVFYPGTDTVIGVIGLSCLGRTVNEIMYPETASKMLGLSPDTVIDCKLLARIISEPIGLQKGFTEDFPARFICILNQADVLDKKNLDSVLEMVSRLKSRNIHCVIMSMLNGFVFLDELDHTLGEF